MRGRTEGKLLGPVAGTVTAQTADIPIVPIVASAAVLASFVMWS